MQIIHFLFYLLFGLVFSGTHLISGGNVPLSSVKNTFRWHLLSFVITDSGIVAGGKGNWPPQSLGCRNIFRQFTFCQKIFGPKMQNLSCKKLTSGKLRGKNGWKAAVKELMKQTMVQTRQSWNLYIHTRCHGCSSCVDTPRSFHSHQTQTDQSSVAINMQETLLTYTSHNASCIDIPCTRQPHAHPKPSC